MALRPRSSAALAITLVVLPLVVAAAAVFLLLRTHQAVLSSARGERLQAARTPAERAAMLAEGRCAVLRANRRLLGKLDPASESPAARASGVYAVQRLDVRASVRVDTALVWIVPCARAARGGRTTSGPDAATTARS